eukprot:12012616-Alexandrium_andersonii.AAC.1
MDPVHRCSGKSRWARFLGTSGRMLLRPACGMVVKRGQKAGDGHACKDVHWPARGACRIPVEDR